MYPNIDEFTEHGQIVIGHIEPGSASFNQWLSATA